MQDLLHTNKDTETLNMQNLTRVFIKVAMLSMDAKKQMHSVKFHITYAKIM